MVRVQVPATSANLGPGFDSLGIALNLYNEYEFEERLDDIVFEGFEEAFTNRDNIIFKAMVKTFNKYDYNYGGLFIKVIKQQIPISRGLGSSSSCIVAGITGAMELMGISYDKDEIFQLAVEIEGHPDNVCPAIFGGMTVSIMNEKIPIYNEVKVADKIKFVAIIPDFRLETAKARAVLPENIKLEEGVFNVSRAALVVSAFTNGKYDLLKDAMQDRFHEQYRKHLIRGFDEIHRKTIEYEALGFYLSGAGPTMMAVVRKNNNDLKKGISEFLKKSAYNYDVIELNMDFKGVSILR